MEQKTEASQAVDELLADFTKALQLADKVGRSRQDNGYARNSTAVDALVTLQMSIEDRIRAALKAQPAPTEAAQSAQIGWVNTKYGNFIPLSGLASTKRNSELLASRELIAVYGAGQLSGNSGELQPSGNTGELAQGEDTRSAVVLAALMDAPRDIAARASTTPQGNMAQGEDNARLSQQYQRITAPGQVKVGDQLRFTLGDDTHLVTAKLLLHAGTDKEEIIYNKRQNYYLITSMAIANRGSQKNCEFRASSGAGTGGVKS